MAYIYQIKNKINGKSYIGKTEYSVERRWKQHIRESKKIERCEKLGANKFQKVVFKVESLKYKILKMLHQRLFLNV